MRPTSRLLAETSKYLEAGRPTGLTGLFTHAHPRPALLYNYHTTLEKLRKFPESSVYRQSTEALTKHRLAIVEGVRPAGLAEWQARVRDTVEKHPNAFRKLGAKGQEDIVYKVAAMSAAQTQHATRAKATPENDLREAQRLEAQIDQMHSPDASSESTAVVAKESADEEGINIEPEPPLTTQQVEEIESQIGAGLVEEIIQVAEAENALVDQMYESRVWEELVSKPTEGQWAYYERDTHTGKTQAR